MNQPIDTQQLNAFIRTFKHNIARLHQQHNTSTSTTHLSSLATLRQLANQIDQSIEIDYITYRRLVYRLIEFLDFYIINSRTQKQLQSKCYQQIKIILEESIENCHFKSLIENIYAAFNNFHHLQIKLQSPIPQSQPRIPQSQPQNSIGTHEDNNIKPSISHSQILQKINKQQKEANRQTSYVQGQKQMVSNATIRNIRLNTFAPESTIINKSTFTNKSLSPMDTYRKPFSYVEKEPSIDHRQKIFDLYSHLNPNFSIYRQIHLNGKQRELHYLQTCLSRNQNIKSTIQQYEKDYSLYLSSQHNFKRKLAKELTKSNNIIGVNANQINNILKSRLTMKSKMIIDGVGGLGGAFGGGLSNLKDHRLFVADEPKLMNMKKLINYNRVSSQSMIGNQLKNIRMISNKQLLSSNELALHQQHNYSLNQPSKTTQNIPKLQSSPPNITTHYKNIIGHFKDNSPDRSIIFVKRQSKSKMLSLNQDRRDSKYNKFVSIQDCFNDRRRVDYDGLLQEQRWLLKEGREDKFYGGKKWMLKSKRLYLQVTAKTILK